MAFEPETKNPGDLIRSADWNAAMTAIVDLLAKMHEVTGHKHTGAVEDAPPIDGQGLADGAVTAAKLAANAVNAASLAPNAVTTSAIADAAITAAKIAAGIVPQIGIAVSMGLQNDALIPVPAGFERSECIFMAAVKWINLQAAGTQTVNVSADANGKLAVSPNGAVVAVGVAFGKKGGW